MAQRPLLKTTIKSAALATACVGVLALVTHGDSHKATAGPERFGGLSASFTGKAFTTDRDGGAPLMVVGGLAPGQGTSGSVTLRNPGHSSRYFWLTPGAARERLGGVGRLTSALDLSVLDVSDVDRPMSVYRGPLQSIGGRPLGFLAPGERRTFTFTASLPASTGAAENPFRGARLEQAWRWQSIPASGAATSLAALRPPRAAADRTPPRLRFTTARLQDVLTAGTLRVDVACGAACGLTAASASVRAGSRTWALGAARDAKGVTVRFDPAALGALRSGLQAGTAAPVRLRVTASDRAGNRATRTHTVTLRPRG